MGAALLCVRDVCGGRRAGRRALVSLSLLLVGCFEPVDFNNLVDIGVSEAGAGAGAGVSGVMMTAGTWAGTQAGVMMAGVRAGTQAGVMTAGALAGALAGARAGTQAGVMTAGVSAPSSSALVGSWESVGADLAPLLSAAPFNLTRLSATFADDGSFVVSGENADRLTFDLSGSFEVTPAPGALSSAQGVIHEVTLTQTAPERAVSEGIWRVEGDTLTYEVVQVNPPLSGQSPPTRAGGFGSSTNGMFGVDNVQTYRRVR